jgi:hypothetical protein
MLPVDVGGAIVGEPGAPLWRGAMEVADAPRRARTLLVAQPGEARRQHEHAGEQQERKADGADREPAGCSGVDRQVQHAADSLVAALGPRNGAAKQEV